MRTLLFIVLLSYLGLTSCGVKLPAAELTANGRIETGTVQKNLFSSSRSDTSMSVISYAYYSERDSLFKDSVNTHIQRFIQLNTAFSFKKSNSPMSREFAVSQLDSFARMYESEIGEYQSEYDPPIWSIEMSTQINESAVEFVQLSLSVWSYTGGAHGNGFSQDLLIDKKTGVVLTLADVFSDVDQLTEIGALYFRESQGLAKDDDLEEAGFWFEDGKFLLNQNFSFNGKAIQFFYNQYEIAPYAAGTIEFEIPLEKIKHLLKRKID